MFDASEPLSHRCHIHGAYESYGWEPCPYCEAEAQETEAEGREYHILDLDEIEEMKARNRYGSEWL